MLIFNISDIISILNHFTLKKIKCVKIQSNVLNYIVLLSLNNISNNVFQNKCFQ